MFDHLSNRNRCRQCGRVHQPRTTDLDRLIDSGRVQIDPAVSREIAERIVEEYFAGRWGTRPEAPFDFLEAGRLLMATYEIGDAVFHVVMDHGHNLIELIQGE